MQMPWKKTSAKIALNGCGRIKDGKGQEQAYNLILKINYLSFYIKIFSIKEHKWFVNKSFLFTYLIIIILLPVYSFGQEINSGNQRIIQLNCHDTIINFEETIIPGTIRSEEHTSEL